MLGVVSCTSSSDLRQHIQQQQQPTPRPIQNEAPVVKPQESPAPGKPACICPAVVLPVCAKDTGLLVANSPCEAFCFGLQPAGIFLCDNKKQPSPSPAPAPASIPPSVVVDAINASSRDPVLQQTASQPKPQDSSPPPQSVATAPASIPPVAVKDATSAGMQALPLQQTTPQPKPSPQCSCAETLSPVCEKASGARVADNLCLALCQGRDEASLRPCQSQPIPEELPKCRCAKLLRPVCDKASGARVADNLCMAQCNGADEADLFPCSEPGSRPPSSPDSRAEQTPQCTDDGLRVGEIAGFAGCTRLLSKCSGGIAIRNDAGLRGIPLCSSSAVQQCGDAALDFAMRTPDCLDFLTGKGQMCTGQAARAAFQDTVNKICSP